MRAERGGHTDHCVGQFGGIRRSPGAGEGEACSRGGPADIEVGQWRSALSASSPVPEKSLRCRKRRLVWQRQPLDGPSGERLFEFRSGAISSTQLSKDNRVYGCLIILNYSQKLLF